MIAILLTISILAFAAFCGIFLALVRENPCGVTNTFDSVLEAIQDIKAYKASKMR